MAIRGPYESQSSAGLPQTLGERIRAVRIKRGFTQYEIASALNTDQATVSGWERDKVRPSGAALAALAMFYAVDTELLAAGKGMEGFLRETPAPELLVPANDRPGGRQVELPEPSGTPILHMDLNSGQQRGAEPMEAMSILLQAINEGRPIWILVG